MPAERRTRPDHTIGEGRWRETARSDDLLRVADDLIRVADHLIRVGDDLIRVAGPFIRGVSDPIRGASDLPRVAGPLIRVADHLIRGSSDRIRVAGLLIRGVNDLIREVSDLIRVAEDLIRGAGATRLERGRLHPATAEVFTAANPPAAPARQWYLTISGIASVRPRAFPSLTWSVCTVTTSSYGSSRGRLRRRRRNAARDAFHIAIAAVHRMDFLLTWNCRHIANDVLIPRLGSIMEAHGYASPVLCTPLQLLDRRFP